MSMRSLTSIPPKVRARVMERDSIDGTPICIFCGRTYGLQIMHLIPRSQGGKGIEENLAVGCVFCHQELDNGKNPEGKREYFRAYLQATYPDWDEEKLKVRKYE